MHLIRIDSDNGNIGRLAWCNSDTRFGRQPYYWIGPFRILRGRWGSTYWCLYGNDKPIRRPPCT